jgi:hypothetical protein
MPRRRLRALPLTGLLVLLLLASPAWATFPTVSTTSNNATGAHPSYTANLPTPVAAGDLLIVCGSADANLSSFTWPGSWVELEDTNHSGSGVVLVCGYLIASGGETTVTLTGSGTADNVGFAAYRFHAGTWHGTTPPEDGTAVVTTTLTTVDPDPPSVTASWGSADNLCIVVLAWEVATLAFDSGDEPTGYGNNIEAGGTSSDAELWTSRRNCATATENPDAFTSNTGSDLEYIVNTIMVRPAAAASCSGRLALLGVGC